MIFKSATTKTVLKYAKQKYGTEPEFLWRKSPNNAILRHRDGPKWYGAILVVARDKLGLPGDGDVEILDLKCDPFLIGSLIDNRGLFPGYHMNKEHWITVLLDGTVSDKNIFYLIDLSHELTKK